MKLHTDGVVEGTPEEILEYQTLRKQQNSKEANEKLVLNIDPVFLKKKSPFEVAEKILEKTKQGSKKKEFHGYD